MSKSDPLERSRISLSDSRDEIAAKLAKAKTDSIEGIHYDDQTRPELANLLRIFSELSGRYANRRFYLIISSGASRIFATNLRTKI